MPRSIRVSLIFSLFCLLWLATGGMVWAAETTTGQETVSSSKEVKEAQKERAVLEKITVTATRTEVDPSLSPADSYVVDRQDIADQPNYYMNNFGEYIRDIPGVHVAQYYPWGPPGCTCAARDISCSAPPI